LADQNDVVTLDMNAKVGFTILHLMRSFAVLRMTDEVFGFRKSIFDRWRVKNILDHPLVTFLPEYSRNGNRAQMGLSNDSGIFQLITHIPHVKMSNKSKIAETFIFNKTTY